MQNNMKIRKNEKLHRVLGVLGMIACTIVAMHLFWSIKLYNHHMPIQHSVNYAGEFIAGSGSIREIVIRHEKKEEPVRIDLLIYDVNGEKCWEKTYRNFVLSGKNQTLDYFKKKTPLKLEEGTYHVKAYMNGERIDELELRFIEFEGSFKNMYTILCILLLIGEAALFLLCWNQKMSLEKIYWVAVIGIGILMNFVMPPLGVPDEQSHFIEAYKISSKFLGKEEYDDKGCLMIREEDYNSMNYLHNIASIAEWQDSFHIMADKEEMEPVSSGIRSTVSTKAPYAYLPAAIGITIARVLGFSGHMLLVMGRLCNLSLLAFLAALAIKLIPWGKYYFLVLGMLPEVIYLFMSYSYDGLNLVLAMLSMSYFLKLYKEKENISMKNLLILGAMLILMFPIKVVYIAFGLFLFLLPIKKIRFSKKQIAGISAVVIVGIIGFAWVNLPIITSLLGNADSVVDYKDENALISLSFVLQNTERARMVVLNTIFGDTNTYFNNGFGEIVGVGRYDGLDCYVLPLWMISVIVFYMLAGLEDTRENIVCGWRRIVGGGIGFFTYLAILASMLFAFTPISSLRILGLQGRYFLPIFALMPLVVKNNFLEIKCSKRKLCFIGMGMLDLMFVFLIFFHYARNYFT